MVNIFSYTCWVFVRLLRKMSITPMFYIQIAMQYEEKLIVSNG